MECMPFITYPVFANLAVVQRRTSAADFQCVGRLPVGNAAAQDETLNGRAPMSVIRPIREDDAMASLELRTRLDHETTFMMFEPGERDQDVAGHRAHLRSALARPNHAIFVAVDAAGALIGYIEAEGGQFRRNCHTATIVVGILQGYAGQGIGTRLFETAETWAKTHGIHRLELTVMVHNTAAHALYTKVGFTMEGRRRGSVRVNGVYVDEYALAKLLEPDTAHDRITVSSAAWRCTGMCGCLTAANEPDLLISSVITYEFHRSAWSVLRAAPCELRIQLPQRNNMLPSGRR